MVFVILDGRKKETKKIFDKSSASRSYSHLLRFVFVVAGERVLILRCNLPYSPTI